MRPASRCPLPTSQQRSIQRLRRPPSILHSHTTGFRSGGAFAPGHCREAFSQAWTSASPIKRGSLRGMARGCRCLQLLAGFTLCMMHCMAWSRQGYISSLMSSGVYRVMQAKRLSPPSRRGDPRMLRQAAEADLEEGCKLGAAGLLECGPASPSASRAS